MHEHLTVFHVCITYASTIDAGFFIFAQLLEGVLIEFWLFIAGVFQLLLPLRPCMLIQQHPEALVC